MPPLSHPLDFSSLPAYLDSAARWVGDELLARIPRQEPARWLYEPARDYPSRGGKRFRPALLLLSAAQAGGDPALALPSALALEAFQNFALVHDDIQDGSLLRRGKPTLHRQVGIPLAINVGDYLFGLVYRLLAENEQRLGAAPAWRVLTQFNQVFGETFEGQAMDIGWIAENIVPDREQYETMIRKKTGWYTGRGPCQIGALIAGAAPDLVARLGDFGETLGIGFQMQDDLLNLAPDSSGQGPQGMQGGYGKERGGDIAEGKRTLIVIELMERLPAPEKKRLTGILLKPPAETLPQEIEWVIDQATTTGSLDAVRLRCREMGNRALDLLAGIPPTPQRQILEGLTRHLIFDRTA
ncbi:MAG: polyprenyl synthetase family protein [Deltaproteobacteria bacterium]|nr:polyprenyl synthetase family protein [Deltaproteobacteria bacterium]